MTNPNNAVGTNGAFGGRTSVNAFNDVMGAFQGRGVLSGWGISPSSGMTVNVGGSGTVRDTAVAEDNAGNKTSINNISGSAISVTLDTAPASNSRYDAIVAYVDKPPIGSATQDNPECCGIIPVTGTAASTPSYPNDGAIRSAITADGASGSTAYYVVLGYVLVASGTTTITSGMITAGGMATIGANQVNSGSIQNNAIITNKINNNAVTSGKIDFTTLPSIFSETEHVVGKLDDNTLVYCCTTKVTTPTNVSGGVTLPSTGIDTVIDSEVSLRVGGFVIKGPTYQEGANTTFSAVVSNNMVYFTNLLAAYRGITAYITRWYTKS